MWLSNGVRWRKGVLCVGTAYRNGTTEGMDSTPADWTGESKLAAREQLNRILESHHFHSSKRCSLFLRYVVEHTIDNHHDPLKERTLGIEIFGRDAMYDTAQDPVVRTTAGEVRKRLAQYYQEPSRQQETRISLPAGGYVPEIHLPTDVPALAQVAPPARESTAAPIPQSQPQKKIGWWTFAIGLGTLALAASAVLVGVRLRQTGLDRFWAPFVQAQEPVIVCLGQPHAYLFDQKVQTTLDRWFESKTIGSANGNDAGRRPPSIAAVPFEDIVPAFDRHISLSDAQAFTHIAGWLEQKGRTVQLRGVRETSLANLRGKPCILVGAFNNEWNLGLTGELRFYFESDGDLANFVRDRRNPGKSDWKVVNTWPYSRPPTDYAIVSRVVNPTTEQTVVTIAGITGFGTQTAGEFLTNETYLAEALKQAPSDWQRKNMQVVLSTRVMSGTAGPPQVLAVHFW
jgi:hypothetical protein